MYINDMYTSQLCLMIARFLCMPILFWRPPVTFAGSGDSSTSSGSSVGLCHIATQLARRLRFRETEKQTQITWYDMHTHTHVYIYIYMYTQICRLSHDVPMIFASYPNVTHLDPPWNWMAAAVQALKFWGSNCIVHRNAVFARHGFGSNCCKGRKLECWDGTQTWNR